MPNDLDAVLGEAEWKCLNEAVGKLEECHRTGCQPDFTQWLPPGNSDFFRRALVELIKIDQEHCFLSGRPKLLEAYLRQWPALAEDVELMAELLRAECMTRAIVNDAVGADELRSRFPELFIRINLAEIAAEVKREGGPVLGGVRAPVSHRRDSTPKGRQYPDRYQLRGIVGRGGMGTVHRAYDTVMDREVALKIPNREVGDDPVALKRFLRESEAVAAIRHPYVCPVFDVGQQDGSYYIAMALIEGRSLAERLRQGPLECLEAARLAYKLTMALTAVHAVGIIHRDLKPQNVMLDAEGEPQLTDFGLARLVQDDGRLTGTYSLLGTPAYMSPEQVCGEPATLSSDIYALGVILYEMLTGHLPFSGSLAQVAVNIARGDPTPPRAIRPEVDPALDAICLKAMAKRPEDRYQSAEEMYDAFWKYLRSPRGGRPKSLMGRVRHFGVVAVPTFLRSATRRARRVAIQVTLAVVAVPLLLMTGMLISRSDKGVVVLEVYPPDAQVYIDQAAETIRPPRDAIVLSPGKHKLEVKKEGFEPWIESFVVRRGEKVELTARLKGLLGDAPFGRDRQVERGSNGSR